MKKLILAIVLFLQTIAMAKSFTYNEILPEIQGGKWKYKCTIRLDLEKRLLNMSGCTILDTASRIVLYNAGGDFIGTYYITDGYERYGIKGGNQYHSVTLDFSSIGWFNTVGIKDVRYLELDKPKWNLDEEDIKCNDKQATVSYTDDDGYGCFVEYKCPKGQYAVDETECESLPKNAIRLPQDGFVCKKGFELFESEDTTYCYKPYQCPKGSYAVSKNECNLLPKNAKRLKEEGYECLDGYMKFDGECTKKARCKKDERYHETENLCFGLPKHAQWDYNSSTDIDFKCDNGYVKFFSDWECREKRLSCGADSVIAFDLVSCNQIPFDADKINEYIWQCKDGFKAKNGACLSVVTSCDDMSIISEDSLSCIRIPHNARKINENKWLCNDGYKNQYGYCEKLVSCNGKNEYSVSEFECGFIPNHAHRVGDYWECDYGYRKNNDNCNLDCGANQILDTLANKCINVPINAHKANLYTAYCNTGYHVEGDDCVSDRMYQNSPKLRPYSGYSSKTYYNSDVLFRLQFEGFWGGTFYEKQPAYSNKNTDDLLAGLGVGISLELDFNENFTIGLANSIRMYITEYNLSSTRDDFSNYLFRDDISASLLLGSEKYKFLLRPVFSIQLIENASINDSRITYKIDNTTWAVEVGVRFWSNHDLFIAFSQSVIEKLSFFKSINRMIWFGYRYNFTFSSMRI